MDKTGRSFWIRERLHPSHLRYRINGRNDAQYKSGKSQAACNQKIVGRYEEGGLR